MWDTQRAMPGARGAPPTPRTPVAAATTGEEPDFAPTPQPLAMRAGGTGGPEHMLRASMVREHLPRLDEEGDDMKDGT